MSPVYRMASCAYISIGRGIPVDPPRVKASVKLRNKAARRTINKSSSTDLELLDKKVGLVL